MSTILIALVVGVVIGSLATLFVVLALALYWIHGGK